MILPLLQFPRFIEAFENRMIAENVSKQGFSQIRALLKEWYDIDVDVDGFGIEATISMSDEVASMFILKWS